MKKNDVIELEIGGFVADPLRELIREGALQHWEGGDVSFGPGAAVCSTDSQFRSICAVAVSQRRLQR